MTLFTSTLTLNILSVKNKSKKKKRKLKFVNVLPCYITSALFFFFFGGRHITDALKSQSSFLTTRTMRNSRLIRLFLFYMSVAGLAFYTEMC